MSTSRLNNIPTPHATKDGNCCYCGKPRPKGRRRWCSQECIDDFLVRRGDAARIAILLFKRDKGICALCGADMDLLKRVFRHARLWNYHDRNRILRKMGLPPHRERFWDADHIVPVVEGGGGCGLDNYRTLCCWCHVVETAKLAERRAVQRRDAARPLLSDVD